jgi:hypothetical protein
MVIFNGRMFIIVVTNHVMMTAEFSYVENVSTCADADLMEIMIRAIHSECELKTNKND